MNKMSVIFVLIMILFNSSCSNKTKIVYVYKNKVGMSLEEAKNNISQLEKDLQLVLKDNPLNNPQSLDDILAILKSDNIGLFKNAVAFASKHNSERALSLQAQIELAWGEAQLILSELLINITRELSASIRALEIEEFNDNLSKNRIEYLNSIRELIYETEEVADAFVKIASEHVAKGSILSKSFLDKYPDSYLGYRVAADYYRLREDWKSFYEMVNKIKEKNPDSNGLRFVLGAAEKQLNKDILKAKNYFEKALEKDSKFTRARVHLLIIQRSILKIHEQYTKLKEISPEHQIVIWAGEVITKSYNRYLERQKSIIDAVVDELNPTKNKSNAK